MDLSSFSSMSLFSTPNRPTKRSLSKSQKQNYLLHVRNKLAKIREIVLKAYPHLLIWKITSPKASSPSPPKYHPLHHYLIRFTGDKLSTYRVDSSLSPIKFLQTSSRSLIHHSSDSSQYGNASFTSTDCSTSASHVSTNSSLFTLNPSNDAEVDTDHHQTPSVKRYRRAYLTTSSPIVRLKTSPLPSDPTLFHTRFVNPGYNSVKNRAPYLYHNYQSSFTVHPSEWCSQFTSSAGIEVNNCVKTFDSLLTFKALSPSSCSKLPITNPATAHINQDSLIQQHSQPSPSHITATEITKTPPNLAIKRHRRAIRLEQTRRKMHWAVLTPIEYPSEQVIPTSATVTNLNTSQTGDKKAMGMEMSDNKTINANVVESNDIILAPEAIAIDRVSLGSIPSSRSIVTIQYHVGDTDYTAFKPKVTMTPSAHRSLSRMAPSSSNRTPTSQKLKRQLMRRRYNLTRPSSPASATPLPSPILT